jgi:hypothetical protein
MGTLTGDVFLELQSIFQNVCGDMGATPAENVAHRAMQTLCDRGFIEAHYNYNNRVDGYVPTARAYAAFKLELASGGECHEPRDAHDARLVVIVPQWAEFRSGLGMSVNTYQPDRDAE